MGLIYLYVELYEVKKFFTLCCILLDEIVQADYKDLLKCFQNDIQIYNCFFSKGFSSREVQG